MPRFLTKLTQWVDDVKEPVYIVLVGSLYAIYLLVYISIVEVDPVVIVALRTIVTALICVFLILKFNPFHKAVLKYFDSTIIFGSAIILLTNLVNSTTYTARILSKLTPSQQFSI
jgi:hypothetical protein